MGKSFWIGATTAIVLGAAGLTGCSDQDILPEDCTTRTTLEGRCAISDRDLKLNDLQTVGTHNSYKRAIPPAEMAALRAQNPDAATVLDYAHRPLTEQLDMGMRQIELDVFYDPQGGRYADPLLPRMTAGQEGAVPYDPEPMLAPGFKVLHVQDFDVHSHCPTFIRCLEEIRKWSEAHPRHVPILIMLNAKDAKLDVPGTTDPLPFTSEAATALDAEILSVFERTRLITPDDVRGNATTLRDGVLAGGWPDLKDARGKVFFALDEGPAKIAAYMRNRPSLRGLPIFVKSVDESMPHAAYFTLNDPVADQNRIKAAVKDGFVVRTRADADTMEARNNETARREAAFASGAHYISTDYHEPRTDFSGYSVTLPGDGPARCNPVRRDETCAPRP